MDLKLFPGSDIDLLFDGYVDTIYLIAADSSAGPFHGSGWRSVLRQNALQEVVQRLGECQAPQYQARNTLLQVEPKYVGYGKPATKPSETTRNRASDPTASTVPTRSIDSLLTMRPMMVDSILNDQVSSGGYDGVTQIEIRNLFCSEIIFTNLLTCAISSDSAFVFFIFCSFSFIKHRFQYASIANVLDRINCKF